MRGDFDEDELDDDDLDRWPNCATPDCEHKACTWSECPDVCFPCGVRRLGKDAMVQRYNETHDHTWEEALGDAPEQP